MGGVSQVVVPLFKCKRCDEIGISRKFVFGQSHFDAIACDSCIEEIQGTIIKVRPIFDAIIMAGISLTIATDAMAFILDRLEHK